MGACCSANETYTSFDAFMVDFRASGAYEDMNLNIAIDCTKSNETSGTRTYGHPMHSVTAPAPNPYMRIIQLLGRFVAQDKDRRFPLYFFGSEQALAHGDALLVEECLSLQQLTDSYRGHIGAQTLSGPTSFAGVVNAVVATAQRIKRFQHLLIITDGAVTDQARELKVLDAASNHPVLISCLGVGDGPWDTMKTFDDLKTPDRRFDNFQFCAYSDIARPDVVDVEKEVFYHMYAEVPTNYRALKQALGYEPPLPTPRYPCYQDPSPPEIKADSHSSSLGYGPYPIHASGPPGGLPLPSYLGTAKQGLPIEAPPPYDDPPPFQLDPGPPMSAPPIPPRPADQY